MNSRNVETNETLQRVGRLLLTRRRLSTLDIVQGARVCAVNSIIAELRDNGWRIHCERSGRNFYYTLLSPGRGHQLCQEVA